MVLKIFFLLNIISFFKYYFLHELPPPSQRVHGGLAKTCLPCIVAAQLGFHSCRTESVAFNVCVLFLFFKDVLHFTNVLQKFYVKVP